MSLTIGVDVGGTRLRTALTGRGYRQFARIRITALGADAGIIGAADLARLG